MDSQIITDSSYAFAADLYESIESSGKESPNIIISPLSVQIAIGMTLMGAAGQTANEISKGLKLRKADLSAVADAFETLIAPLAKNPMLKIANKVYVQNSFPLKDAFKNVVTKKFRSEADPLDFAQAESSAHIINHWVQKQTNNLIKNLISQDQINADTRLLLINAIYFKGLWANQFDASRTAKQPFFTNESTSVDVDMMQMECGVPYAAMEKLDSTAVQLKYKDSTISMIIVLPNKRTGLAALDAQLKTTSLEYVVGKLHSHDKVKVSMPKFKVEFSVSLTETLKKMGMNSMFSANADLSGMLEKSGQISVSDVLHKAFIEVNEEGTEAAAAVAAVVMLRSMPMKIRFKADHPFHYFIVDGPNVILFSGSYRCA